MSAALWTAIAHIVLPHAAFAQPLTPQRLTPLGDNVESPLLPTGVIRQDVHASGQLAYLWQAPTGEQVAHVVGDFTFTVGARRLSAKQGVIWMEPRRLTGLEPSDYQRFEVFLYRDAEILEPAGTINEGPLLFATLNTIGDFFVSADKRTFGSSAETTVYRNAASVREQLVKAGATTDRLDAPPGAAHAGPGTTQPPPVDRIFRYNADHTQLKTLDDGGQVAVGAGGVNVFIGSAIGGAPLEARADAVVIFFTPPNDPDRDRQLEPTLEDESDAFGLSGSGVQSIYLEGDIRLTSGDRTIRASRIFYDLKFDRALILDAVMFAMAPDRNLPIYIRADQIRQLSDREFLIRNGHITTSEFHTPHYHIGAETLEIVDRTPKNLEGERVGLGRASFKMKNLSFNLDGFPVLYWPGAAGNLRFADTALRGINVGYNDNFGTTVETRWDLFNLLSFEPPVGFQSQLRVDYFTDRGPAMGLDVDYERESSYGLYRGYVIDDHGDDNLGRFRDNTPDKDVRGRTTWRHRQYLPEDWELTFELSYISDRGFLEEYFESEFDRDKEQETVLYAKKQRDNWAFTATSQYRLNTFETRTERLPDFSFHLIGEPIGEFSTWFSEFRAGGVRYRDAEKDFFLFLREGSDGPGSGGVVRGTTRQELQFPFDVGPLRLVPFVAASAGYWDDSPTGGGLERGFAMGGFRGSMYFTKTMPDHKSEFWDIDGVRHIIKADFTAWGAGSNRDSDDFFPFDNRVEGVDDFDGVTLGLRQRWQTKRGAGPTRRTVDFLTLDVELGLFNDAPGRNLTNGFASYSRPENSVARNYLNTALIWRMNDATALLSEMNYDINDGEVDIFNLSFAVDRSPRLSYLLGYRFIEESDSNLLGFGLNYKIDRKHSLAFREQFDIGRGETLDFTIAYIRKYPRWYVAWIFELDRAEDVVGLSLSVWPEGLERVALGTRRFTGLATSASVDRF